MRDDVIHVGSDHPSPLEEAVDAVGIVPEVRLPKAPPRPPIGPFGKPIRDRPGASPMGETAAPGDELGTVRLKAVSERRRGTHRSSGSVSGVGGGWEATNA